MNVLESRKKRKKEKEKERVGEKKRVRACWNVLECEGEKENKRTGGGNRDRTLDTCVEEKNKIKKNEVYG